MATKPKLEYKKTPAQISSSLQNIVAEIHTFYKKIDTASTNIKTMDNSWFGPERDGFVKVWNKNVVIVNKYLEGLRKNSTQLENRINALAHSLGFKPTKIEAKKLSLPTFSAKGKQTGTIDNAVLTKLLSDYITSMKNAIASIKKLKTQTTQNYIGIISNSGGFREDVRIYNSNVTIVLTQIEKLHKSTEKFVNDYMTTLSKADA